MEICCVLAIEGSNASLRVALLPHLPGWVIEKESTMPWAVRPDIGEKTEVCFCVFVISLEEPHNIGEPCEA